MNKSKKKNTTGTPGLRSAQPGNIWIEVLMKLIRNKIAVVCFFVFMIICLSCVFAPFLTKWDYREINIDRIRQGPTSDHILGTDALGRDYLARLLYGGRVTLRIAFVSTTLAMLIGSLIGLTAGYFGKRADFILSQLLDVLASIPIFLLVLAFEVAMGWGRGYFMYAMAIAAIPQFARLARATTMSIAGSEYIVASRALGVSHPAIILKHVLHNVAPPLIVRFTTGFAEALLTCTLMGYLSIGISPPTPEWGALVYNSRSFIRSVPRLMIIPCSVITACVISISLFGDGLRDAMDPRKDN